MTRQSYVRSLLELSKPYGGVIEVRASGHYRIVCGDWYVTASGSPKNHDHSLHLVRQSLAKKAKEVRQ